MRSLTLGSVRPADGARRAGKVVLRRFGGLALVMAMDRILLLSPSARMMRIHHGAENLCDNIGRGRNCMDIIARQKGIASINDPRRGMHGNAVAPVESTRGEKDVFVTPLEGRPIEVTPESGGEPTVRDIMTSDVRSCRADRSLVCAGTAMHRGDCRFLPVVTRTGKVVGVITDGDICEIGTADYRPLREILVSEAMSTEVFTCRPEDRIAQVLETMKKRRVRHLPVVGPEGRLLGVVSLTDVILRVEENGQDALKSLRPGIAEVLRVVSQKERGVRNVQSNAFRED
jgi:CBS domain-containing protein